MYFLYSIFSGKYQPNENQQQDHHQNQQYEVQYQPTQQSHQQYRQGQVLQYQQNAGHQQEQAQAYVAPAAVHDYH